jgi:hypothetical protein
MSDGTVKPPATAPWKKTVRVLLGWAVGAGLLVLMLRAVDTRALWAMAVQAPPWLWLAGAALWWGSFVCRAARMRQEWRWLRPVSLWTALRLVLLHNAAVLLLPMRAGELGYPLLVRQVFGAGWRDAVRSLMWLRIQDAVVLGLLAVVLWPQVPLLLRVAVALAALAVWLLPQRFWRWLLTRRHPLMRRLRPWLHHRSGSGGWWWSAGNWLLKLAVVTVLLHQLAPPDLGLALAGALRGALGGELAALIPVQGPAGLGTYEAAVWALSGVAAAQVGALAGVALLVHSFCLSVSLCFAALWGLLARWPAQAVAQSRT